MQVCTNIHSEYLVHLASLESLASLDSLDSLASLVSLVSLASLKSLVTISYSGNCLMISLWDIKMITITD
jgi:hypothetical protein